MGVGGGGGGGVGGVGGLVGGGGGGGGGVGVGGGVISGLKNRGVSGFISYWLLGGGAVYLRCGARVGSWCVCGWGGVLDGGGEGGGYLISLGRGWGVVVCL